MFEGAITLRHTAIYHSEGFHKGGGAVRRSGAAWTLKALLCDAAVLG